MFPQIQYSVPNIDVHGTAFDHHVAYVGVLPPELSECPLRASETRDIIDSIYHRLSRQIQQRTESSY